MSDVVWCDVGGHLMSANDPDRTYYTQPGNEYGQDIKKGRIDVCGRHQVKTIAFPTLPTMEDMREEMAKQKEIG